MWILNSTGHITSATPRATKRAAMTRSVNAAPLRLGGAIESSNEDGSAKGLEVHRARRRSTEGRRLVIFNQTFSCLMACNQSTTHSTTTQPANAFVSALHLLRQAAEAVGWRCFSQSRPCPRNRGLAGGSQSRNRGLLRKLRNGPRHCDGHRRQCDADECPAAAAGCAWIQCDSDPVRCAAVRADSARPCRVDGARH